MPDVNVIPNFTHFFIQMVSTLILFLVIRVKLWGPMSQFLKKRQDLIAADFQEAESAKADAFAANAKAAAKLEAAEGEARQIIQHSKETAQKQVDQLLQDAESETANKLAKAETAIKHEREVAYHQMQKELLTASTNLTEKLIKKTIDPKVHQELFADFIAKVGESVE